MWQFRAGVDRNTTAFVQDLDRRRGEARLDGLTDQPRRYRVIVLVDLDVIIGTNQTLLPFGVAVRLGWKRTKRRPVDRLQQLNAALADLAHDLGVEVVHTLADRGVQLL